MKPTIITEIKGTLSSSNASRWKPSIKDSQDSFVVHLTTINNLEKIVSDKRKKCEILQRTLQPFIIIEGETISKINNFYIYFDNIYLKLNTFVQCVDACFKIFQVFSLKYPVECDQVWTFLQQYFYNILTTHDKNSPQIFNLISRLNLSNS